MAKTKKEFDKYLYYLKSVQSPEDDVQFLKNTYEELKKKTPRVLTEDFCGTFKICCEWAKLNPKNKAIGIDLSEEPIQWGKEHHLSELEPEARKRITLLNENVMAPELPTSDIIAAMNFSYNIFKSRQDLKAYFTAAKNRLNDDGLLICDIFGGTGIDEDVEEETVHDDFSYFWHQETWDPVTRFGKFHIHFKRKGEKKREEVFTYDWRLWTIPEIRDLMDEIGFSKTHVYWEGTDEDGDGDGEFKKTETGEACEGWIAYIVAEK